MTNLPTLKGFIAFAKAKPSGEEYTYLDTRNCAFTQYLQSLGYEYASCGGTFYNLDYREDKWPSPQIADIAVHLNDAIHGNMATDSEDRWTFGALAARLELLALTSRETGFPVEDAGFTQP